MMATLELRSRLASNGWNKNIAADSYIFEVCCNKVPASLGNFVTLSCSSLLGYLVCYHPLCKAKVISLNVPHQQHLSGCRRFLSKLNTKAFCWVFSFLTIVSLSQSPASAHYTTLQEWTQFCWDQLKRLQDKVLSSPNYSLILWDAASDRRRMKDLPFIPLRLKEWGSIPEQRPS